MEFKHAKQLQLLEDVEMKEKNTGAFEHHLKMTYELTLKIKKDKTKILLDIDTDEENDLEVNLLTLASLLDLCLTFEMKMDSQNSVQTYTGYKEELLINHGLMLLIKKSRK